jgi:hypothetical protein
MSEGSANLAVLSREAGLAVPRKSDFVPQKRGNNKLNRSEINANVTFLGKLSNKETY